MLAMKLFEHAQTECTSSIFFVRKKDGTLRFFLDYHNLNTIITMDSYPLLRLDEWIDFLGDAKIFPTVDTNSDDRQFKEH